VTASNPSAAAIRGHLIAGYSDPAALHGYRTLGLFPAEARLVDAHFPPGGTVLDLGCGTGRTSIPLWKLGFRVHAVDITPAMIAAARAVAARYRADLALHVQDAQELAFPDASFDGALFSYNGIGHLPRRAGKLAALREIRRVLRPGAAFVFSVHHLCCRSREARLWRRQLLPWALAHLLRLRRRDRELGELFDDSMLDLRYLHVLPARTYRRLLRAAGFEVELMAAASTVERRRPAGRLARLFRDDDYTYFVARRPPAAVTR
jgi:SAM-dependent methyltransferase